MEERVLESFDLSDARTKRLPGYSPPSSDVQQYIWRLRFELPGDVAAGFDLELDREITLGTMDGVEDAIDLKPYDAVNSGVSRKHLKLIPTETDLIAVDLNSTNGSCLNERPLRPNVPYRLLDGDLLSMGGLQLLLRVILRPGESSADLRADADLAEALAQMGKALTAELDLASVLNQAVEMAMSLTAAVDTSIWLINAETATPYLAADRSSEAPDARKTPLSLTQQLLMRVLQTGKPARMRHTQDSVRLIPDALNTSLLYVPMNHKGTVIGAMGAVHKQPNRFFNARDERLLGALADFVAIAVHNAQLYQDVRDADQLKEEMIQNIAHEFRTPLTYVMGYMEMLLVDPDRMQPKHEAKVRRVFDQSQRMSWLVDNIVSLATLQEVIAERSAVDPAKLLADACDTARLIATQYAISVELDLEKPLPLVEINQMAILQVMDNLLGNAFKFTPTGGQVVVTGRFDPRSQRVTVSVSDSGIGIAKENQERVFDRFYQVDATSTRRYSGVGIGLALCKAIIQEHGEKIWVDCPECGGSVFSFTLPPVKET